MSDGAIVGLVIGLFGLLACLIGGSYGFTWLMFSRLADRLPCMQASIPPRECDQK